MKKILQTVVLFFLTALSFNNISAQSFENGEFGIQLSDAGEIEVYSPDLTAENKQIDRFSVLAAIEGDTSQVFDYREDADSIMAAHNVANPLYGDYQLYTMFDNSYVDAPPNVVVKLNVFGWNDKSFALAKYAVINDTNLTLNTRIGYEAIPQVDGQYGFEMIKYEPESDLVSIFVDSTTSTTGFKILSGNFTSVSVIDWFSGYDNDPDFSTWLYSGAYNPFFESGTDGSVIIMGANDFTVEPGDSAVVWVGIAYGEDKQLMELSMADLVETYQTIVTEVKEENTAIPSEFALQQNYPNPFNPSTKIKFSIPESGAVRLTVFDILGRKVADLLDSEMEAGNYVYDFEAASKGLSSGIYFYNLKSGSFSSTKKMILIK